MPCSITHEALKTFMIAISIQKRKIPFYKIPTMYKESGIYFIMYWKCMYQSVEQIKFWELIHNEYVSNWLDGVHMEVKHYIFILIKVSPYPKQSAVI